MYYIKSPAISIYHKCSCEMTHEQYNALCLCISSYSLSILKRQLERSVTYSCVAKCHMFTRLFILIIRIFLLEIFLNARNKECVYKNLLVVLLNKTIWFYLMERTRFGTWKTRMCQIFCMHFQSVPHNQNIKKCIYDNEFHLLLNTTKILMHVSFGIITKYLICGIWRTQKVWRYT